MCDSFEPLIENPAWQTVWPAWESDTKALITVMEQEGLLRDAFFTAVFTDDAAVQNLNREFCAKDAPTNVLSFPSAENIKGRARRLAAIGHTDLGDVILALETVQREAAAQGKNPRHHAQHLLVHGILHLLGYDHMKADDATRMEALEVKILKKQGIANPYL